MACSLVLWLKRKLEENVKSNHGTENNDGENEKKAKYDRDGNRLIRKMWFKEFEWLDHDEEKGLMFCNVRKPEKTMHSRVANPIKKLKKTT